MRQAEPLGGAGMRESQLSASHHGKGRVPAIPNNGMGLKASEGAGYRIKEHGRTYATVQKENKQVKEPARGNADDEVTLRLLMDRPKARYHPSNPC